MGESVGEDLTEVGSSFLRKLSVLESEKRMWKSPVRRHFNLDMPEWRW